MTLKSSRQIFLVSFGLLIVSSPNLLAATVDEQLERLPGRWTRERINIQGEVETWTKTVIMSTEKHEFIETIRTTGKNGERINQWQVKFRVTPVAGRYLRFQGLGIRDYDSTDKEPWRPMGLQYMFQIDRNFKYEVHNMARGVYRWQRVGPNTATIDPQHLTVLRDMLGTFRGEYASAGSEAYGIAPSQVTITSSATLSPTGSLITQSWTSVPKESEPEKAFEAHVVYSYDPSSGRIIKQYQTSTGVAVKGTLISWQDKKLLWERSGDTPKGPMYELCLFDFSDTDIFKHVILKRTLNGKAVDVDEAPIILKRVK